MVRRDRLFSIVVGDVPCILMYSFPEAAFVK